MLAAAVAGDAGGRRPTPAMKRFADSMARQKGIKPPRGYAASGSICRAFLDQHAPKKAVGEMSGESGPKPASPAQILFAEKIAQQKGIVIPEEARLSSAAMSSWIDSNRDKKRGRRSRKTASNPRRSAAPKSTSPTKRSRKHTTAAVAPPTLPASEV